MGELDLGREVATRVLIVAERAADAELLATDLVGHGLTPRVAPGAGETCRDDELDCVVLLLPAAAALSVLRSVLERCSPCPVICLVPDLTESLATEMINLGAYLALRCPVDSGVLAQVLRQGTEHIRLDRRRSQQLHGLAAYRAEELAYANRQLMALNVAAEKLSRMSEEEALLNEVPRLQLLTLDFDRATLLMKEGGALRLRSLCWEKDPLELRERFLRKVADGSIRMPPHFVEALEQDRTIFIPDLNADPRWPREPGQTIVRTKAMVVTPIRAEGRPVGVLVGNMQHHERPMNEHDIARFETFANLVSLTLDNIRAYSSMGRRVEERTAELAAANRRLQEQTEELRRRDERLRQIIEASPVPIFVSRVESGEILYVNRQLSQAMGLEPEAMVGHQAPEFYENPADRLQVLEKLKAQGEVLGHEMRFRRADGSTSWTLLSAALTELDGERVVIGGISDISERKKAERELATRLRYEEGLHGCSEALLRDDPVGASLDQALESLRKASGVCIAGVFTNVATEGGGLETRLANAVRHPNAPDLAALLAPISWSGQQAAWRDRLSAGEVVAGAPEDPPDSAGAAWREHGVLSWLLLPIRVQGAWWGLVGMFDTRLRRTWRKEDITSLRTAAEMFGVYLHRRRVQESLRMSEERFRTLVEKASDIIYQMSPDGRFTYVSPNVQFLTGYSVEEYLGRGFSAFLHPDDRDAYEEYSRQSLSGKASHFSIELRAGHRDGTWLWYGVNGAPVRDAAGQVIAFIGIARDINERKVALEYLARANQELKETQAQLVQSEKMAALGQLVAGIAHEINTPVGAIHSMQDTLSRAVARLRGQVESALHAPPAPEVQTTLEAIDEANRVIRSGSERVTTIVRRLRSFARLDESEIKKVDIHEGIEDTLLLMQHSLKHRITVVRRYGDLPHITCFPGRLNQVFLNLLNNARQAIPAQGTITIATAHEDGSVMITISDTGVGIPPEHLPRVFDPGFTTKGVGVGTGLGLSICYRIVQEHFGTITVNSRLDEGTAFTIILPTDLERRLEKHG